KAVTPLSPKSCRQFEQYSSNHATIQGDVRSPAMPASVFVTAHQHGLKRMRVWLISDNHNNSVVHAIFSASWMHPRAWARSLRGGATSLTAGRLLRPSTFRGRSIDHRSPAESEGPSSTDPCCNNCRRYN